MKEMTNDRVFDWDLRFRKLAVVGCTVALLMCVPAGAQGLQADSKDNSPAQLLAQASTPQAAAPVAKKLPIAKLPVAVSPALRQAWAKTMHRTPAPKEGCFQA